MNFAQMHVPRSPFILANAWDAGSAKMLVAGGAKAIGTSSAAHAFTLGRIDGGTISRDEALSHAQDLMSAVDVPVSGDFGNGFGDDPDTCAETARLSAEIGLSGFCIEDTPFPSAEPYPFDLSVERVRAAAAVSGTGFFVARADGIMNRKYDIEEALRRIIAFDKAGADGIYVPLPRSMDDLRRIVTATKKPVNVLASGPYAKLTVQEFAAAGVARISLGSALARLTHKVIADASHAIFAQGEFSDLSAALSGNIVDEMLVKGPKV
ncbi:MAG: isocitrate lyase/phosphoenolpyruvate mutase family protein [Litoreibacter sp.]